jgi:hypothetical protein
VLLLPVFTAMQCNKYRHEISYIDPYVWSITNIMHGSYWIMKDSVTGNIDSILFVSNSPKDAHGQVETYGGALIEKNNTDTLFYWTYIVAGGNGLIVCFSNNLNNLGTEYRPIVSNPFSTTGAFPNLTNKGRYYCEIIPQAIINGHLCDSVYHYHCIMYDSTYNDHIYFNKQFGLIKIIQKNPIANRTLFLEQSHIVRY